MHRAVAILMLLEAVVLVTVDTDLQELTCVYAFISTYVAMRYCGTSSIQASIMHLHLLYIWRCQCSSGAWHRQLVLVAPNG
jgi:hypothetical protein